MVRDCMIEYLSVVLYRGSYLPGDRLVSITYTISSIEPKKAPEAICTKEIVIAYGKHS